MTRPPVYAPRPEEPWSVFGYGWAVLCVAALMVLCPIVLLRRSKVE